MNCHLPSPQELGATHVKLDAECMAYFRPDFQPDCIIEGTFYSSSKTEEVSNFAKHIYKKMFPQATAAGETLEIIDCYVRLNDLTKVPTDINKKLLRLADSVFELKIPSEIIKKVGDEVIVNLGTIVVKGKKVISQAANGDYQLRLAYAGSAPKKQ